MKPSSILTLAALAASASCQQVAQTSPAPQPTVVVTATGSTPALPNGVTHISDAFTVQRGEAALQAFVPDVPADEKGGECMIDRTTGSGATRVTAFYPARTTSTFQITLTFDSVGHVVRYSERRGIPHGKLPPGATRAQLDSAIRVGEASIRSTSINLDYPIDQAIVMNRGGGKPPDAVTASIREIERDERFGPITARIERMRKLCGV